MTSSSSSSPPHPHPLTSLPIDDSAHYPFGPSIQLPGSQLFFLTSLSLASVNLAPVVPGHALICPRRLVKRVQDMTPEELTDSWLVAQAVGVMLTRQLHAPALTFAIQDGKEAGQSVPHVHIHVMPRRPGDFSKNDDIYGQMEHAKHDLAQKPSAGTHMDEQQWGKRRTAEEMQQEARQWRDFMRVDLASRSSHVQH